MKPRLPLLQHFLAPPPSVETSPPEDPPVDFDDHVRQLWAARMWDDDVVEKPDGVRVEDIGPEARERP